MDGGWILRALMARNQPYVTATRRAAGLAKVLAVAGAIVAVFAGAPLLILVSMFVYVAASSESRATVLRELLRGFTARDLMDGDVRTVDPDTSVADLIETVVAERRTAFPVVEAGSIRGVVTLGNLQRIETGARESTRVGDVHDGEPTVVAPESDAFELVLLMGENRASHAVVADGGARWGWSPRGTSPRPSRSSRASARATNRWSIPTATPRSGSSSTERLR